MNAASLIARLAAAGTPPELLGEVAVALSMAEAELAILAKRRENERNRKAKAREVTGLNVTARDSADSENLVPNEYISNPPVTPNPTETTSPTDSPQTKPWTCPEGVDRKHWRDLLANRKKRRLANTETAYDDMLADIRRIADDEWPPGRLVHFAAGKGWGGIYDPRKSEQRNGHGPASGKQTTDPLNGLWDGFGEDPQAGGDAERPLSGEGEHLH